MIHHSLKGLSSIPESKREAEKLKEAKGGDDGGLWDVCRAVGIKCLIFKTEKYVLSSPEVVSFMKKII